MGFFLSFLSFSVCLFFLLATFFFFPKTKTIHKWPRFCLEEEQSTSCFSPLFTKLVVKKTWLGYKAKKKWKDKTKQQRYRSYVERNCVVTVTQSLHLKPWAIIEDRREKKNRALPKSQSSQFPWISSYTNNS